jgi:hypothetical protein
VSLKRFDLRNSVYRITERNRPKESPLKNCQERHGIDPSGLADQSGGDRHSQQSMGHGLAERAAIAERMVDMQRVEVPGEPGEQNDIRFGNSPARTFPFVSHSQIVECPD